MIATRVMEAMGKNMLLGMKEILTLPPQVMSKFREVLFLIIIPFSDDDLEKPEEILDIAQN